MVTKTDGPNPDLCGEDPSLPAHAPVRGGDLGARDPELVPVVARHPVRPGQQRPRAGHRADARPDPAGATPDRHVRPLADHRRPRHRDRRPPDHPRLLPLSAPPRTGRTIGLAAVVAALVAVTACSSGSSGSGSSTAAPVTSAGATTTAPSPATTGSNG